jgi:hypothetical protein
MPDRRRAGGPVVADEGAKSSERRERFWAEPIFVAKK